MLLASSALLFEGFLCVIFLAPIYFIFAGLVLWQMPPPRPDGEQRREISDTFKGTAIPLLVVIASVEGITRAYRSSATTR